MVKNKRYLVVGGMYLPNKLHAVIEDIKTLNYRLRLYDLKEDDMIQTSFYNEVKLLYDNLLYDVEIEIEEHAQASTMML